MFLIVYTIKTPAGHFMDEWQAFEAADEARAAYQTVLSRADIYTACMARPIESTEVMQ